MIDAIIKVLHDTFGNKCRIYTENVEQGLKTPCFSLRQLSANGNRYLQNRYKNTHQFMVQYFPDSKDVYSECAAVLQKLLILLVDVGKYHASKINGEVVDGVLNFEVVYPEFVQISSVEDDMTDYEINWKDGSNG